jgi:hypothetical protein
MNEELFTVFADRDETQGILLCKKLTFAGAICAVADAAEFWDRLMIYQGDKRLAVVSLKGA